MHVVYNNAYLYHVPNVNINQLFMNDLEKRASFTSICCFVDGMLGKEAEHNFSREWLTA